ncbi:hypothetical protein OS175_11425 [Marinicella sp. S1101]|uniref:hypothetical protein n=1 Tax=Marinicella marina TaxID=2996016 RepID=UPI002260E05E|nr:hypothetical protein [Marinicella marina]MCX7554494.1 hypothetical protein [Marinicella marina]MDJ1140645.1 hypothetical protein [Marinicella marina]
MQKHTIIMALGLFGLSALSANADESLSDDSNNPALKNDMGVVFGPKDQDQLAAAKDYSQWVNELYRYLVASDDSFAIAMTLAARLSSAQNASLIVNINQDESAQDKLQNLSYQPIADALNLLLTQDNLTPEAMNILSGLCFNEKLKDYCHANVLIEKRLQLDSENLQSYLQSFALASEANNQQAMAKLIALMANSQFSHTVLFITPEMNQMIDQFMANNPVPESFIESMIRDYQQLSGLSPAAKTQLPQLMPAYMPHYVKYSFGFLNEFPPYRPVLNYCKSNRIKVDQCSKIAQIMIQKSNSMIDKALGHSLLIATYEVQGDNQGVAAANKMNDQFRASYECLQDLAKAEYFMDDYFDSQYHKIQQQANDEYSRLIAMAEYRYQKFSAQGHKGMTNPTTCLNSQM